MNVAGRVRGLLERILARRRDEASAGVPDSELLRRFTRDRDEAAFELIVWRHGGMVLGLCRRAVRDEQLAEDAFQAVFLVLARKVGAVRGNLGGWLFKVARRVSARALKNRPAVQPAVETAAAPTADSAERDELSALLDAEVARLPERLRRAVVLCYLGGHSTEDAARELGCPRGTVLSRLATARKRLAERLTRRGVTLPATLATAGLSGRLVSSAAASAPRFLSGSFALSPATQLADGVIRTMSRTTIFTAMGGVLVAATLATGVGWVAAQPGPNPGGAAEQPAPVAANPKADPPAKPPTKAESDVLAARVEAERKLKKLEQLAETLKIEIEAMEKQIELLTRANGAGDQDRATAEKQLAEIDDELRRLNREIVRLEAELSVLKKRLDDKAGFEHDPVLIANTVSHDGRVVIARGAIHAAKKELEFRLAASESKETVQITAMKAQVAKAEKEYAEEVKSATETAIATARATAASAARQRIAKLATEIEIQKEVRETLRSERDTHKKLVAAGTKSGLNIAAMRQGIEPQREMLMKLDREILVVRLQRDGVTFSEPSGADTKLDAILRELAALRKEVRELKEQKK